MKPVDGAVRHDNGKARIDLLPLDVLRAVLPSNYACRRGLLVMLFDWWAHEGDAMDILGCVMTTLNGSGGETLTDFPEALMHIGRVLAYAPAQGKYEDRNWEKGMLYSRPWSAACRHLLKMEMGESFDHESGYPHLAHAATNILMLATYEKRGVYSDYDDRPRVPDTQVREP